MTDDGIGSCRFFLRHPLSLSLIIHDIFDGDVTPSLSDGSHHCCSLVIRLPPLLAPGGAPHDPDSDNDKDDIKNDENDEDNNNRSHCGSIPPCGGGGMVDCWPLMRRQGGRVQQ